MAAGDTALWLHNKLGSTDDLWSGKSICSQLTNERLLNIQDCFHVLQSHVKVKLLLSILHIPRRNVEQWISDLEEIVSLGINDPDPWVATVGEILREYPTSGALLLVEPDSRTDSSMIMCLEEMKELAKNSTVSMLPLECQYLNKSSLAAVAGHIPESSKHFTVKRKPKSAALRAEIIQKSSETMLNKRNHASSSIPIKSRSFAKKMDTIRTTPGGSSLPGSDFRSPGAGLHRLNSSLGRSPITPLPMTPRSGSKKEGKIKILEIEEMPVGAKEAKRRKKIADMEALEAQKKEKEAAAATAAANPSTTVAATTSGPASYTPDYAAGLIAPATPKMPMTVLSVSSSALPQPSPAYLPTPARQNAQVTTLTGMGTVPTATAAVKQNLPQQLKQQLLPMPASQQSTVPNSIPMLAPILITPQQQQLSAATTNLTTAPMKMTVDLSAPSSTLDMNKPQHTILMPQTMKTTQQVPSVLPAPIAPPQTQAPSVKKGLSLTLTKEQLIEAQEMFKVSNKVSRPEKALILGFMAGSKDNPCPDKGEILNIKLSEKEEIVELPDGSVMKKIEDTYFQMNFETGQWKRFVKSSLTGIK